MEQLARNRDHARKLVRRALDLFGPSGLAFSFNGGKDSTVVLHLLLDVVAEWRREHGRAGEDDRRALGPAAAEHSRGLAGMRVFCFRRDDDFEEVLEFVRACNEEMQLELIEYTCGFKEGLQELLNSYPVKAIFLGTRLGDPNATGQEHLCPSSEGWPPFIRINPILRWSYSDVWAYLREEDAAWCSLYDDGYTSLGSVVDTHRNSALLRPDGTYAPAYMLADDRLERAGRVTTLSAGRQSSSSFSHTAAVLIVGDEVLRGHVTDRNTPFLAARLRALGFKLGRVVVVPDTVEVVARELRTLSEGFDVVCSCGGLGPTSDDCTMRAVADAFQSDLVENAALRASVEAAFGSRLTAAHLKMALTPAGCTEVIPYSREDGSPAKFPLVKIHNVFVLPGVPDLVRTNWPPLAAYLAQQFPATTQQFHNRVLRLRVSDEAQIAELFEDFTKRFPDVSVGSYPVLAAGTVSINLEAKDGTLLDDAVVAFRAALDCHADASLHTSSSLIAVEEDVRVHT